MWGGFCVWRGLGGLLGGLEGCYTGGGDRVTALMLLTVPTMVLLICFVAAWLYGDDDD